VFLGDAIGLGHPRLVFGFGFDVGARRAIDLAIFQRRFAAESDHRVHR
jgi:hypothetical protein